MLRALIAIFAFTSPTLADLTTVGSLARIQGHGEFMLQGQGLVVGLPGTGDSAKDLMVARPLAEALRAGGLPIADFAELKNSKSVAVVKVLCRIPPTARSDDVFDVTVHTLNSASSLKGGTLYITAMTGPFRGDQNVYAMAEGEVRLDDPEIATKGVIHHGMQLLHDMPVPDLGPTFNLIVRPEFAGYAAATEVASAVNQMYFGRPDADAPPIATALDDRMIRIEVPMPERASAPAFVGDVLSAQVNTSLLKLPARVVCNEDTGIIICTEEVRISPVAITHKDLTISTTFPVIDPTPASPVTETTRWAGLETGASPTQTARLQDLLAAFKQLNVPPKDQISILRELHRSGQLHADLIFSK